MMKDIIGNLCVFFAVMAVGTTLKCYQCSNPVNEDCGVTLNETGIEVQECQGESVKCGTQIQDKDETGWTGVIRACYVLGTLPGMNEANGCHTWTNTNTGTNANYTARYCFCDTDGCNKDVSDDA